MSSVCFIVPVYNAENYIQKFEDSVLKHSRNEIFVFVNDASTDRSLCHLDTICNNNRNCYLINMPYNSGQSRARNHGIEFVIENFPSVTHISFLDADDTVSNSYFDDLGELESDKVYVKDFVSFDSRSELIDRHTNLDLFEEISGHEYLLHLVKWQGTVSACNKLIPVSKILKFIENTKEEDTIYTFELAIQDEIFQRSKSGSYNYHRHPSTSTSSIDLRIFDIFFVLSHIQGALHRIDEPHLAKKFRSYWINVVLSDRLSKATILFRSYVLFTLLFSKGYNLSARCICLLFAKSSYQSFRRKHLQQNVEKRRTRNDG